ncbi:MAG: DinB family protein [Acidobacteria bacterium]|nr:DinB family protein [Acidobacteriota bacterium]
MATYGAAELAASFRTVRKNTIQIAEEIPEDQYGFAAAAGVRTVAQLLVHMAVAPRIWQKIGESAVTTLVGFDFMTLFQANMAEELIPRTKAEILALLAAEGETFASHLDGLTGEFLAGYVTQPDGLTSKSRLETMMGAKEHEMHHRGQLMLIERMHGITPHLTRAMQERFAQMAAAKA